MRGILLIEVEALQPGAGATMIRLAARARSFGVAPIASACFLHDARPTFAEALEGCVGHGASEVVLVPYALTTTSHTQGELARLRDAAVALYPGLAAYLAEPLSDHPSVAQVMLQRAAEADYVAAHPFLAEHAAHRADVGQALRPLYLPYPDRPAAPEELGGDQWRPTYETHPTALLLAVQGPMHARTSRPLYAVAEQIRRRRRYAAVRVCFVDGGQPRLDATLDELAGRGIHHAFAVPCTLQHGDPLIPHLASEVEGARARHPGLVLIHAEHLGYDRRLVEAIGDRVAEALHQPRRSQN